MENKDLNFKINDEDIKNAETLYRQTLEEQTPDMWASIASKLPDRGIGTVPPARKPFKKKYIWGIAGGVAACILCMVISTNVLSWLGIGVHAGEKAVASNSAASQPVYDYAEATSQDAVEYDPEMYSLDSGDTTEMAVVDAGQMDEEYADEEYTDEAAGVDVNHSMVEDGRKLIKTINLDVETMDFDTFVQALKDKVETLGGYFETSNIEDSYYTGNGSKVRTGSFVIRVPKDQIDVLSRDVSSIGNVVRTNESVEDVTLQYTDTQTHIDALKAEQEKLLELMKEATSVEDTITIESRISDVSRELEYYQSLMNQYDNQIDYATLNIELYEVEKETDTQTQGIGERMKNGLLETFENISEGCQNLIVDFVSILPYLGILAIIVIVIVVICKSVYKKHKK